MQTSGPMWPCPGHATVLSSVLSMAHKALKQEVPLKRVYFGLCHHLSLLSRTPSPRWG